MTYHVYNAGPAVKGHCPRFNAFSRGTLEDPDNWDIARHCGYLEHALTRLLAYWLHFQPVGVKRDLIAGTEYMLLKALKAQCVAG